MEVCEDDVAVVGLVVAVVVVSVVVTVVVAVVVGVVQKQLRPNRPFPTTVQLPIPEHKSGGRQSPSCSTLPFLQRWHSPEPIGDSQLKPHS